jgi:pimeloyl-ACP methyl ester carboxylesterase
MTIRHLLLSGFLALLSHAAVADAPTAPTGLQENVIFTDYSAYSRDSELLRRSFSPLLVFRGLQETARSGVALREQDIDLKQERFALYVPDTAPPNGYSLLVFVSPFDEVAAPRRWKSILDRHGMIFVTAANSGNGQSTIERREPLALLAAQNVMNRYKIDPQHVYVAGLSGGSRVAEHTALGYPDLFHGALLNAGSDPLGGKYTLPPADLFRRFQETSRLVYVTGDRDDTNLMTDAQSRKSMKDWCMFSIDTVTIPDLGHKLADPATMDYALDLLVKPRQVDMNAVDDCRKKIDTDMNAELDQVQAMQAAGKIEDARAALGKIDARYGGLAAKRVLELERELNAIH